MSDRLLPHKNKEIIKKLEKNGFIPQYSKRHKRSKHLLYWKKDSDEKEWAVIVSKNPSETPPRGTLENIIETSGKSKEEFSKR